MAKKKDHADTAKNRKEKKDPQDQEKKNGQKTPATKGKPVDKKQQPDLIKVEPEGELGKVAQKYVDLMRKRDEAVENMAVTGEVLLERMKEEKKFRFICDGVELTLDHVEAKDKLKAKKDTF